MIPPSPSIELVTADSGEETTTRAVAEGASDKTSPEIVTAGPPGIKVCVPMTKSDWELAVRVDLPRVRMGRFGEVEMGGSGMVEEPKTSAVPDGASETMVPEMVNAGPPGMRVWLAIM